MARSNAADEVSAEEVVRAAAGLVHINPDAVLARLEQAHIVHAWQLVELLEEDWSEIGASRGLVSAVRKVLGIGAAAVAPQPSASDDDPGLAVDPPLPVVRNLDTGEYVSEHDVDHMLSQLTVTRLPREADAEDQGYDESLEWPMPSDAPGIPETPRASASNEWRGYEEAMATYGQLCSIIKRALSRCRNDKRMGYEARILVELLQDLEATGVLVIADWPSKLLLNSFRDIIARFFGKPQMPWHGVLFLHRAEGVHPGKTQPTDEFVCSYIDSMAIDEAYADRNLSAAYVAFKRFKEENPWVTHANIKTECASAEVWLVI